MQVYGKFKIILKDCLHNLCVRMSELLMCFKFLFSPLSSNNFLHEGPRAASCHSLLIHCEPDDMHDTFTFARIIIFHIQKVNTDQFSSDTHT